VPHKAPDTSTPTWSWASSDSLIDIRPKPAELIIRCTEVINAYVDVDVDGDPFGNVKGGALTMRSKFLAFCGPEGMFESYGRTRILLPTELFNPSIEFEWDYDEDHYCLLVMFPIAVFDAWRGDGLSLEGLLLRGAGKENGQYKRVGMFWMDGCNHRKIFPLLLKDRPGVERETSWGSGKSPTEADYVLVDVDDEGSRWYTINIV